MRTALITPPTASPARRCPSAGFFLPVRVLSRLFHRLFLEGFATLNQAGRLACFGDLAPLADQCISSSNTATVRED
jgi:hypothetical protein